jgi:hypothetical protein
VWGDDARWPRRVEVRAHQGATLNDAAATLEDSLLVAARTTRDLSCRSPETARRNGGLSVARRRPSGEFQAASRATLGTWLWTAESHLGGAPCARGDHSEVCSWRTPVRHCTVVSSDTDWMEARPGRSGRVRRRAQGFALEPHSGPLDVTETPGGALSACEGDQADRQTRGGREWGALTLAAGRRRCRRGRSAHVTGTSQGLRSDRLESP